MPVVRGCNLPDELAYDVPNNLWYRAEGDGTFTVGMTMVAAALAGNLVAFTAKKAGKTIEAGKSVATVESGKWVGPVKIGFDAEILAVNEDLSNDPKLVNTDTYGGGWMVRVRPVDPATASAILVPGAHVAAPYEAKMTADAFAGCAP